MSTSQRRNESVGRLVHWSMFGTRYTFDYQFVYFGYLVTKLERIDWLV